MKLRRIRMCAAAAGLAVTMMGVGSAAAAPPAQGQVASSYSWGNDGWLYMAQGGRWVRTTYQRVVPDARYPQIYDLYAGGRFVERVDTTTAGWIKELPAANLAGNAAFTWMAHPTNAAATDANTWVLVKAGNRWVNLAAAWAAARARTAATAGSRASSGGLQSGTLGGNSGAVISYGGSSGASGGLASSIVGGVRGPVITTTNSAGIDVTAAASRVGGYTYRPLGADSRSPQVRDQGLALDAYLTNRRDTSIKVDSLGTYVRVPYGR